MIVIPTLDETAMYFITIKILYCDQQSLTGALLYCVS